MNIYVEDNSKNIQDESFLKNYPVKRKFVCNLSTEKLSTFHSGCG